MTAELQNLKGLFDPFADTDDNAAAGAGQQEGLIHIRIQQRNGRKTLTTAQGIHPKFDLKKMVKVCKKDFNCNGTVVEHPEYGEVIQLQGDKREAMKSFLVKVGIASNDQVKVHGF
ncbi:eukaryotic translation initiation factor eIF1-like [Babylonia areolata]|uniref:eukaryotic translation initiation factor eIF1-like n=1 Tax=Babylonia areolata TaxID=304850 RepID=UPI003FD14938